MKPQGPLKGVKVLEFVGLGPAPFCAMMLSDMGAEVVRVERPGTHDAGSADILARGRRSLPLNLKDPTSIDICRDLIANTDILIEGYRPGVMERLGLGPDMALGANPALIYGRMTGWGQTGPLSQAAGHDINYIALTGALAAIGEKENPSPPLNLVGDFGGGAMYLAFGVLAALTHARATGEGQVVDAAIVDGAASLMASQHQLAAMGLWNTDRGSNLLDGGAHFYSVYQCLDGKHVSIGPLEPEFYALLCEKLGLDPVELPANWNGEGWIQSKQTFKAIFKTRTRDQWCEILEGTDVCFAPVLNYEESAEHPHMKSRNVYETIDKVRQPAPAPRFSKTPGKIQISPSKSAENARTILEDWGVSETLKKEFNEQN